jgi:hypothetical protein
VSLSGKVSEFLIIKSTVNKIDSEAFGGSNAETQHCERKHAPDRFLTEVVPQVSSDLIVRPPLNIQTTASKYSPFNNSPIYI